MMEEGCHSHCICLVSGVARPDEQPRRHEEATTVQCARVSGISTELAKQTSQLSWAYTVPWTSDGTKQTSSRANLGCGQLLSTGDGQRGGEVEARLAGMSTVEQPRAPCCAVAGPTTVAHDCHQHRHGTTHARASLPPILPGTSAVHDPSAGR